MKAFMKTAGLAALVLTLIFALCGLEAAAISFGTIAYHIIMRLSAGKLIDRAKIDPASGMFRIFPFENRLYLRLKVHRWKKHMPAWDEQLFSLMRHTPEEILTEMCRAEMTHLLIAILSFLPVIASLWLGQTVVFAVTSVLAAAADLMFVIMQRYNRPRIMLLEMKLRARRQKRAD